MSNIDAAQQAFYEEAYELLAELEEALLELEDVPDDQELINRVFRAMHTIKGSGAMFGFDEIAAFTHDVETVFDNVRNGVIPIDKQLLGLTLKARDHIKGLLDDDGSVSEENATAILQGLRTYLPEKSAGQQDVGQPETVVHKDEPQGKTTIYRIHFFPDQNIFLTGTTPNSLLSELSELGEVNLIMRSQNIPLLQEMDPELCYAGWDIILTSKASESDIRFVFMFVEDDSDLEITIVDDDDSLTGDNHRFIGEILVEQGRIDAEKLDAVLSEKKRIGDLLVEQGLVSREDVESALVEQQAVRKTRGAKQQAEVVSSIRVQAEKLDQLVDLVGELVIVQARLSQYESEKHDPTLTSIAEELQHLSDELRDSTLGIRMLPIGTTFSKFKRLVRDLSEDLAKEIELVTSGAETELDKTVIDRLGDPLVHLLRNSIDHGIEHPDVRAAQGKKKTGTIGLAARHAGGEVIIEITDDGAGIDAEALLSKAIERGVVSPDAELSEQEIFKLIFAPGMSTAKKVTNVSGRGVGMDVVKRNIDALRGRIDINSKRGEGTTITIKLPLTLAIIDGLQVRVGKDFFVVPLSMVMECVEFKRKEVEIRKGKQIIRIREEIVPYLSLRDCFSINGSAPSIEQVVVTTSEGRLLGLVVDEVIGEHQTVIKSLGRVYRDVPGISGATIKGDGNIALIVDIQSLVRSEM